LFLDEEGSSQLVPTVGECPSCKKHVIWAALMKELSLRLRGGEIVSKILKPDRKRRPNTESKEIDKTSAKATQADDYMLDEDDDLDENWISTVDVESGSEKIDRISTDKKGSHSRVEIVIEDSEIEDFD
jgi:structure-specific endonuclease subunit SLX1